MIDREKVIRALEQCTDTTGHRVDCYGCYQEGPGFGFACRESLMRDALALLRETEPVEPIKKPGIVEPYKCGACGAVLGWESEKQRFCPKCGRGIKWNG